MVIKIRVGRSRADGPFPLDITVELATSDECLLTKTTRLILESSLNGNNVGEIALWAHESRLGIWRADRPFAM
jgi:hypothetical protein